MYDVPAGTKMVLHDKYLNTKQDMGAARKLILAALEDLKDMQATAGLAEGAAHGFLPKINSHRSSSGCSLLTYCLHPTVCKLESKPGLFAMMHLPAAVHAHQLDMHLPHIYWIQP